MDAKYQIAKAVEDNLRQAAYKVSYAFGRIIVHPNGPYINFEDDKVVILGQGGAEISYENERFMELILEVLTRTIRTWPPSKLSQPWN